MKATKNIVRETKRILDASWGHWYRGDAPVAGEPLGIRSETGVLARSATHSDGLVVMCDSKTFWVDPSMDWPAVIEYVANQHGVSDDVKQAAQQLYQRWMRYRAYRIFWLKL